ncbi:MAG: 7-carboxy-7-deazaguanine synthase QueE [Candidatus Eremiobacteraeota bacterium]|nr:7-carboxy-7-deazaguanine synthase QueE [Candidatus Eremiobacteraeota bacterium]
MLQINEIFYSLQGEGSYSGVPAVFVRLAGCNLSCDFCDTDYSLKSFASIEQIVEAVRRLGGECPMVILTGGEPLAQAETLPLIDALARDGRRVHIESNGTILTDLPHNVWLTVSPKERLTDGMAKRANEAKLIVDQRVPLEWLSRFPTETPVFLQPEGNKPENIALAIDAIKAAPRRLRLSLQTHKMIGIR